MLPRCWDEEEMVSTQTFNRRAVRNPHTHILLILQGIPPRLLALASSLSRKEAKRDVGEKLIKKRKADAEPEQPASLIKAPSDRRQHAEDSACMAPLNGSTNSRITS